MNHEELDKLGSPESARQKKKHASSWQFPIKPIKLVDFWF